MTRTTRHSVLAAAALAALSVHHAFAQDIAPPVDGEGRAARPLADSSPGARLLLEALPWPGPWLDLESERVASALAERLLPASAVRQISGAANFGDEMDVEFGGRLAAEFLSVTQMDVARTSGFDRTELREIAGLAPADTTMLVCLSGPFGPLARQVLDSIQPATRKKLEFIAHGADREGLDPLVARLDRAMGDGAALFVRPNDYKTIEGQDPPNDGQAVFAWMAVGRMTDRKAVDEIRQAFGIAGSQIGLKGRRPSSNGFFMNSISGGLRAYEYWSPNIPGTGHLATAFYGDWLIVSNSFSMVDETLKLQKRPEGALGNGLAFNAALDDGLGGAKLAVYLNPAMSKSFLQSQAAEGARVRIENAFDEGLERPIVERLVLAETFDGRSRDLLTADESARFEELVGAEIKGLRERHVEAKLPGKLRAIEQSLSSPIAMNGSLTLIDFNESVFRISSRTLVRPDK